MSRLAKQMAGSFAILLSGCAATNESLATPPPCTAAWYEVVESKLSTGDARGHGPDLGSLEWKSVVEFKLGVRGSDQVPGRDTEQWCEYIDQLVRQRGQ